MRHDRVDIDRAHTLTDCALHTQQTNAILVFHQFTDGTDATVTEVVNIVDFALAVLQVHEDFQDGNNVLLAQHAQLVVGLLVET